MALKLIKDYVDLGRELCMHIIFLFYFIIRLSPPAWDIPRDMRAAPGEGRGLEGVELGGNVMI